MMVESEAKELSEETMLGAVVFAHKACRTVINAIIDLAEKAAKDPWEIGRPASIRPPRRPSCEGSDRQRSRRRLQADRQAGPPDRRQCRPRQGPCSRFRRGRRAVRINIAALKLVKKLEAEIVRGAILKDGRRIDGRNTTQVRPIEAMVHFLPRTHGSALFTRGETQAICSTTLGTADAEQMVDGLNGVNYERFMLHYNFPPYSVGEVGRFGAPGRREVGHGKLAWRALHPVLPTKEEFPYTIRVLSDITESQRLLVDGDGVRRFAGDDGCGRALEAPRLRASRWA